MTGLIKREDAIKAIEEWAVNLGNPKMLVREDAILVLKDIPSVEPTVDKDYLIELIQGAVYDGEDCARLMKMVEPKQGEWIKHDEERDYCSVCKHIFKTRILTKQDKWTTYVDDLGYNFCPNCGARMKGADDA